MKILFDHQTFTRQEFGGISRYFYELIKSGRQDENNQIDLSLVFTNNAYINEGDLGKYRSFFQGTNFKGKVRVQLLLNQLYSIKEIQKYDFDVLHPTYYDTYFLKYIKGKPFTITFLDMIHEKFVGIFPGLGYDRKLMSNKKILVQKAPKVIAISEATKKDLVDMYGISGDKVEVIHLGSSFDAQMGDGERLEKKPYLLFVGSRERYKNFHFCLEALADVLKKYGINFVCAGGGPFITADLNLIRKLGLENQVKFYKINNSSLANLYRNAEAFIFPSLYEGFGIPVLEAFSCNCSCLLSSGGSLPEVGGDSALYFDPSDANSIQQAVEKLLNDKELNKSLRNKGQERLKLFSWNKTYEKTLELYQSIV